MRCDARDVSGLHPSLPKSSAEVIREKGLETRIKLLNFLNQKAKEQILENILSETERLN